MGNCMVSHFRHTAHLNIHQRVRCRNDTEKKMAAHKFHLRP